MQTTLNATERVSLTLRNENLTVSDDNREAYDSSIYRLIHRADENSADSETITCCGLLSLGMSVETTC